MQTQPEDTVTPKAPQAGGPSPPIDQAVLDLLTRISGFSDAHFDPAFMALNESELEPLVVLLLQHWTDNLEGRLLAGCLLVLREGCGLSARLSPPLDAL